MKLSTKGRYAVTAMLDLAIHEESGPVTLADISRCQGISLSYLEQLFARLRRCRLVSGVRGPGGGYRLARGANSITVAEVIAAVDDTAVVSALSEKSEDAAGCPTCHLWEDLSNRIYNFLDRMTLSDLVSDRNLSAMPAGDGPQGQGSDDERAVAA